MKCSVCGGAELEFGVKKVPYSFRGRKTLIEAEGEQLSKNDWLRMQGVRLFSSSIRENNCGFVGNADEAWMTE